MVIVLGPITSGVWRIETMLTRLSLRIRFERRSDLVSLLCLSLLLALFLVTLGRIMIR